MSADADADAPNISGAAGRGGLTLFTVSGRGLGYQVYNVLKYNIFSTLNF